MPRSVTVRQLIDALNQVEDKDELVVLTIEQDPDFHATGINCIDVVEVRKSSEGNPFVYLSNYTAEYPDKIVLAHRDDASQISNLRSQITSPREAAAHA